VAIRAALALATMLILAPAPASGEIVPVAAFDSVLTRFLHGERVDYRALARDPGALRRFLATCENARPERASRSEQIAFWVNVYNARVLDAVIRRPGLKSVMDAPAAGGAPAVGFFDEKLKSAGRLLSLNEIERDILRHRFKEPRVHFVLNCASIGCPRLPERALVAGSVDTTLDKALRRFLADPKRNRLAKDGSLELSSIFKWYAEDFADAGGVAAFVASHWPGPERVATPAKIRFLDYDWSLNGDW
jgi:hypothetical protein